jgi:hypothetical protein
MADRQYVSVRFNEWDQRRYTYHNDGEPVKVGDTVTVETRDGLKEVYVLVVTDIGPDFETKGVVGI